MNKDATLDGGCIVGLSWLSSLPLEQHYLPERESEPQLPSFMIYFNVVFLDQDNFSDFNVLLLNASV